MAYTPIAYTDANTVKRILRTQNKKILIGTEPGDHLTPTDLDSYILDASRLVDSILAVNIKSTELPLTRQYPEIQYSAPRIAAFLIYRDMYSAYRIENIPGPNGWFKDAQDNLKIFVNNINSGVYPELSPATTGPGWTTAQKTFQNEIGVSCVNDMVPNVNNTVPQTSQGNIGPYSD